MMSFPTPGIMFALDFPIKENVSFPLMQRLGDMTRDYGGRLYSAKDACMTPEQFRVFYPNWQDFARYRDPAFTYKFVAPHGIGGVRSHEQRGWHIVMESKDGPKLAIGATSKEGEPMELEGLILMRQPIDVFERNERDGSPGTGLGQRHFDLIESMIADPGGLDGIARQGGQYAQIVNETKPNRVVSAEI